MRDIDAERAERHAKRESALGDRSFKFGGEVFSFQANPPYWAVEEIYGVGLDTPGDQVIPTVERTVEMLLDPDDNALERFRAVLRSKENPITTEDLRELMAWLVGVTAQTPTLAPSPSTDGDANTRESSTENSSSLQAVG